MSKWLLNYDWLTVNYLSEFTLDKKKYSSIKSFIVEKRPYSTRHFRDVYELFYSSQKIPVATIVSSPLSSIIDARLVQIKVANYTFYSELALWVLKTLKNDLGLTYLSISRLDICVDSYIWSESKLSLTMFGLREGYLQIKSKKSIQEYYDWYPQEGIRYQGVKFGSTLSNHTYKIYNKTREIKEVSGKKYIETYWLSNGFPVDREVFRHEFSITKFELITYADGELITEENIFSQERQIELLNYYIDRNVFKHNTGNRFNREVEYTVIPRVDYDKPICKTYYSEYKSTKTIKTTINILMDRLTYESFNNYDSYNIAQTIMNLVFDHKMTEWFTAKKMKDWEALKEKYSWEMVRTGNVYFTNLFKEDFVLKFEKLILGGN